MLDWMSPLAFTQTIIRVFIVWVAFYGIGYLLEKKLNIKKILPLLPLEIIGALALILLEIPLSLLGIMNRTVTPILLLILSIPGLLILVKKFKAREKLKISITQTIFLVFLAFILLLNLTYSSMPNLIFDDPLITYAVQPDRWLNEGKIYWLEETTFSGFPLTYEMMSVWPASLSSDRLDQLSILQVFNMTLLIIAIFRGMQIIQIKKKYWALTASIILMCTMLYYWSSLAKTDTAAILFCTLALASAIRELKNKSIKPYTSWFLMGLAFATKQTSLLVFIPFILYAGYNQLKSSMKTKLICLAFLSAAPLIFATRTMIHTGSPLYPERQVSFLVKDAWRLSPPPDEIILINDRDSEIFESSNYSIYKHIGIFFASMEGIFLLLLGGFIISMLNKKYFLFLPLILYFVIAIIVLWPPWWGAKYSILIYPFVGLLAVSEIQVRAKFTSIFLIAATCVAFIVPNFIMAIRISISADYKYLIIKSVITEKWDIDSDYRFNAPSSDASTQMWLNQALPKGTTILSLHEEKRYFCDHTIYVGWRHPATQPLYLKNTLEEECRILDSVGIEYVTFYRDDPAIFEMENRIEILNHIGHNMILEPLHTITGNFTVYKYTSPFQ